MMKLDQTDQSSEPFAENTLSGMPIGTSGGPWRCNFGSRNCYGLHYGEPRLPFQQTCTDVFTLGGA